MIVRNQLLSAIGVEARNALGGKLSEVVLPFRSVIFEPGEDCAEVYFPSSGVVSLVTQMRDGAAVESLTVGREGAVGLFEAFGRPKSHTLAMVQIAGSAWRISAADLRGFSRTHPVIESVALRYAQMSLAQLHQGAACNALHDIESRLCRWLLTCEDRIGSLDIPLTQEFLAIMLGVQRTSVTAAAQALQRKGLIRYRRGTISIVDRARLEVASCECIRAVEMVYGASVVQ